VPYACLPSRASRLVLLRATTVTMVTAGAGMSVESTSPAAMSTAAGVVAIVLAPRAAVNTEGEDVRRRRFRTEPAVAARTVAAADRVSEGSAIRPRPHLPMLPHSRSVAARERPREPKQPLHAARRRIPVFRLVDRHFQ
jgi:hypothetical protein